MSVPELTTMSASLHEFILRPRYYSTADQAVTWIICVFALLSNSLTIVTLLKTQGGTGQKVSLYILSLSFSDILMVPTLIIELTFSKIGYEYQPLFDLDEDLLQKIYRRERICNILLGYMYYFPMCTSLMTLFSVAVDRLVAISRPVVYVAYATAFRIKAVLLSIWIYGAFTGAWIFIYPGLRVSPEQMVASFNPIDYLPPEVNNYFLMPNMFVAVLGNATAYIMAYRQFKRLGIVQLSKVANGSKLDQMEQRNLQRNRRFYRMVVATVCTQLFFWTPYTICYNFAPLNQRDSPQYLYDYVQPFVYAMTVSNSWINPFLYAAFNRDYRKAYNKTLRGMIGKSNTVGTSCESRP